MTQFISTVLLMGVALGLPASVHAKPAKVIIIGLDGVSLNVLQPFAEAGVTPNLKKLMERGASGDLASFWPLRTPQVWTSVVTGKLPGQHGLWDNVAHSYYNPPPFRTKERKLLTTRERKSMPLWTLLSKAGMSTLVSGWISSWPAEEVPNATIVAPAMFLNDRRQSSIKGSFFRDAEQQVAPASLWPKVQPMIVEAGDVSAAELARFADPPAAGSPLYSLPYLERYVYTLSWSIAREKTVHDTVTKLYPEVNPDVLLAYFQCSDSLLHRFWIFHQGEDEVRDRLNQYDMPEKHSAELTRRFGNVVSACYRDIDRYIGSILTTAAGEETLVLVVSDHGFGNAPKPHPSKDEPFGGNHRDDGVIIAVGPGIAPKSTLKEVSVLDVTPTVLYWLGQPVAKDMRGKVIPAVVGEAKLKSTPIKHIPTYESAPQTDVPFAEGWPERKQRPLAIDE